MSDPEREPQERETPSPDASEPGHDAEAEEDVPSPFDHPAFLPVLLWGLALWFGYDGWISQDPEMLEHTTFNRWGFAALAALATYFTLQSLRESRASRRGQG